MPFYKILPASSSYKAAQPLIYSSDTSLRVGQLVTVPLKKQLVAGISIGASPQPSFDVKPITEVIDLPPVPKELLKLSGWMSAYYATGIGLGTRQLVSLNNLKNIKKPATSLKHIAKKTAPQPPPLTREQNQAIFKITSPGTYLLHGETGSGKTRVYLELATRALSDKKSVIILTPEIGLTTQLENQFKQFLTERVIVTHSSLTISERRNIWQQIIAAAEPLVIIGPRSALFAPLKNIGLIVIDECHDNSYKQNEAPHYQASTVAAKLSQLHDCPLVLGSATPAITDYYLAQQKDRPILKMTELAAKSSSQTTKLDLVDLRDRTSFKHASHLSDNLIMAVKQALASKEQALLFLNRRGTARVVICLDCGWTATCPHCGLPLTYHADTHRLRCHACGYQQAAPSICPSCRGANITYKSIGSKAIEEEAKKLFPGAKIKRFDSDSPKAERLEQIFDKLKTGKVDIIIGTQTIAKGLDLPNLSVVGVIVADTSLYLPDYLADERTYQLIRQVLGRIGRGHRASKAVIQTYSPNNPVIESAIKADYAGFFKRELAEREKYNYPPACHLLKLEIGRASAKSAETGANKLKKLLQEKKLNLSIDGPSPSFHEVRGGKHYYQLVIKSKNRSELLTALKLVPSDWRYELDPQSLL